MSKRIKELRQRKVDLLDEAEALTAKVDAGTADDQDTERLEAITAEGGDLDQVNASISQEEKLMNERRTLTPVPDLNEDTDAEAQARTALIETPAETAEFANLGEQLQAVAHAGQLGTGSSEEWDSRLRGLYVPATAYQAASGANEGVGSEGGFLVQTDQASVLFESMMEGGQITSRVNRIPISSNANGIKIPTIDEKSRVDGSRWGGVQSYWAGEAATVNATKPTFREIELSLKKLFGLMYATEELLQDSSALNAVAGQAFSEEMTFKAEDAIVNGDGVGKPLGWMNSGAVIEVAKEGSQAAATVVTNNILKMWARMPSRARQRAVWFINQDIEPQLFTLTLGSGTAVVLLYRPPGVEGPNANSPFGTLLGRPVVPVEYAQTLGTKGDISLVDLGSYIMIDKEGVRQNASMHVRFIYDEMTFKWTFRADGQPTWRQPVTPKNGTSSLSPFVTLATRS